MGMSLYVTVPISTEVIELNPDCAFSTAYEDGVLMITVDTRCQKVHQRLRLSTKTRLHWGKDNSFEAQELSAMAWPKLTGADAGRILPEGRRAGALHDLGQGS
jgi:hypothetical protein